MRFRGGEMNHIIIFVLFFTSLCASQSQKFPGGVSSIELLPNNRELLKSDIQDPLRSFKYKYYRIADCGIDEGSIGWRLNNSLELFLQGTRRFVMQEVRKGTTSAAYRAFFKDNSHIEQVYKIFSDIILGVKSPKFPIIDVEEFWSPILVCATKERNLQGSWNTCHAHPQLRVLTGGNYGNYMFLCPRFFNLPVIRYPEGCPHFRNGRFSSNDGVALETQYAQFVQGMGIFYLLEGPDFFAIADAVDLDDRAAILSSSVYGYFAQ
ncbi:MAG: hypothetical protein Q9167_006298, partial [Letrouitia subvulpina]